MEGNRNDYLFSPFPNIDGALEIIKCTKEHTLKVNEDNLKKLLLDPKVKDRYVSIISIIGRFRQGKSFLLSVFLFYLHAKYGKKVNDSHWLRPEFGRIAGDANCSRGFHYKHGTKRDTEGILMWPEIFLATLEDGKEVAIILVDTQGAFDAQTPLGDSSTLFALSSFISSVEIYNLMRQLQADDLNYLEYFAGSTSFGGPQFCKFQKLLFLVRDWSFAFEHSFGNGQDYLDQFLLNDENIEQTRTIIENLQRMFDAIACFLLPKPGSPVSDLGTFRGNINDLEQTFIEHVELLAISLLAPENLTLKTIQGDYIKAEELYEHIMKYARILGEGQVQHVGDSLLSMLRGEFIERQLMKNCGWLFECLSKLCSAVDFDRIKSDCCEIIADFFKHSCNSHSITEKEGQKYFDRLKEKFEEWSSRSVAQHKVFQHEEETFFENLLQQVISDFERTMTAHVFACDEDFELRHQLVHAEYKQRFENEFSDFVTLRAKTEQEALNKVAKFTVDQEMLTKFQSKLEEMKAAQNKALENKMGESFSESHRTLMEQNRDSFRNIVKNIVTKTCLLFEHIPKLYSFVDFDTIQPDCYQICTDFFKESLKCYAMTDKVYKGYSDQLQKELDDCTTKSGAVHKLVQNEEVTFRGNLLRSLINAYERAMGENIFEKDEDFEAKHEDQLEEYTRRFAAELSIYLAAKEKTERETLAIVENVTNDERFRKKLTKMQIERKQALKDKWVELLNESHIKMLKQNRYKFENTAQKTQNRYESNLWFLSKEYESKLKEFCAGINILDEKDEFLSKLDGWNRFVRTELQQRFDMLECAEEHVRIKEETQEKLWKNWQESYLVCEGIVKEKSTNSFFKHPVKATVNSVAWAAAYAGNGIYKWFNKSS